MTRKYVDTKAALPVRPTVVHPESDRALSTPERAVPATPTDTELTEGDMDQCGATPMFHFGQGADNCVFLTDYLPYSTPTLQFPAPEEAPEDEMPQQNLFFSYVCEELNAGGICFDDIVHPFMADNIADDLGEPQLLSPGAGEQVYRIDIPGLRLTDPAPEPYKVPVYPQWKPPAFQPPVAQHWTSYQTQMVLEQPPQPNFEETTRPRIVPTTASKAPRTIAPKCKPAPRAAPSDAFDTGEPSQIRGRRRALSPDARAAAREVRIMHACGRCHKKREKCGTARPCKPCSSKHKRSLDLPCMQELPEARSSRLFTSVMYGHFEFDEFKRVMPKSEPHQQSFEIRLNQYFDDPELRIPVAAFTPKTKNDTKKSIFPIGRSDAGYEVQQTEILSPPLVPSFKTKDSLDIFKKKFYWSLRRWLDQAEIYEDIQWHQIFFRAEYGNAWPRAILDDICTFYHQVTKSACPVLKSCLQSTVLVYMIGHSFYVPDDDVEDVLRRTFGPSFNGKPTEWVSPLYVDRFLKILLFPVFKAGVKATLRGLQNLYSPARPSEFMRDRMLATSIVLLIIAGSQQSKAIEKALARHRQGLEVDRAEVSLQIQEIEKHIIDLVLELWEYKFPPGTRMGVDEPSDRFNSDRAKEFNLMERFRSSYHSSDDAATLEALPTDLPGYLDSRKFGANNIERILKKFYLAVFPSKSE